MLDDFNDAKQNANLIPKGTIAKVRLTIRPGGFDDPSQGWTGGYAKRGTTGSVYLDVEYTVLEGPYAKRKIWSMIGLYSAKGPDWANMGRSARARHPQLGARTVRQGQFAEAQNARRISGFADLDGIEFVARIDIGTDSNGEDKNDIRQAVTRDHKDYAAAMGGMLRTVCGGPGSQPMRRRRPGLRAPARSRFALTSPSPHPLRQSGRRASHLGEVRSKARWRRSCSLHPARSGGQSPWLISPRKRNPPSRRREDGGGGDGGDRLGDPARRSHRAPGSHPHRGRRRRLPGRDARHRGRESSDTEVPF